MIFSAWGRLVNLYEQRLLKLLAHHWAASGPAFEAAAHKVAHAMAAETAAVNASSWRAAAFKSANARKVYEALEAEIARGKLAPTLRKIANSNAILISSLPDDIARIVSRRAAEMAREGLRPAEIEREIRELRPTLIRSRVKMIARTEISKAETDLTRARSERIGIPAYVWQSSQDARVRASHRNMNGVIVLWNDTPAPEALIGEKSSLGHYDAGSCPQCRCLCLPLADLSEVRWPCRCYRHGAIVRMTRTQFTKFAGIPMAA